MFFREVPGLDEVKVKLRRTVSSERIPHAQLFHGPEGSGKLALALAYSRYILCTDRSEKDACGKCPSCIKFAKLAHPDLHFVFPASAKESESKMEDKLEIWRGALLANPYMNQFSWYNMIGLENKQGIIAAAESVSIIRKLGMKAYESDHKIMIIWLPERMNRTSANRLLKIIEEPPAGTVFLMVTESVDDLLPTILSRTQMIRIPRFSDDQVKSVLLGLPGSTAEKVADITRRANGNLGLAIQSMEEDPGNQDNFEGFVKLTRLCWNKDIAGMLDFIDEIAGKGRERQKQFLMNAMRMVRENFMVNQSVTEISYMSADEEEFSVKFSKFIREENVFSLYEELNLAYNHISANAYARIVFLDLSLKIMNLLRL